MALVLLACSITESTDTAGCLAVIEVDVGYTLDGDEATAAYCFDAETGGVYDYGGCCPGGWEFVAVGAGGYTAICCLRRIE